MIDHTKTLLEIKDNIGLCCYGNLDAQHLVMMADIAMRENVNAISTEVSYVHMIWSWLEKTGIEIFAKIPNEQNNMDIEQLGMKISSVVSACLKSGADGVQIRTDKHNIKNLVSALFPVKDDLFFGKKLYLDIDIYDIDIFDWEEIFFQMNKIRATGIAISGAKKHTTENDDLVGRLYGLFDFVGENFNGNIQFIGFDISDVESVWRLQQKMCPELKSNFFLSEFKAWS